eukprot:g6442.t1
MDPEVRLDPSSGEAYTKEEFISYYGGTAEWDAAAPMQVSATPPVETVPPMQQEVFPTPRPVDFPSMSQMENPQENDMKMTEDELSDALKNIADIEDEIRKVKVAKAKSFSMEHRPTELKLLNELRTLHDVFYACIEKAYQEIDPEKHSRLQDSITKMTTPADAIESLALLGQCVEELPFVWQKRGDEMEVEHNEKIAEMKAIDADSARASIAKRVEPLVEKFSSLVREAKETAFTMEELPENIVEGVEKLNKDSSVGEGAKVLTVGSNILARTMKRIAAEVQSRAEEQLRLTNFSKLVKEREVMREKMSANIEASKFLVSN